MHRRSEGPHAGAHWQGEARRQRDATLGPEVRCGYELSVRGFHLVQVQQLGAGELCGGVWPTCGLHAVYLVLVAAALQGTPR